MKCGYCGKEMDFWDFDWSITSDKKFSCLECTLDSFKAIGLLNDADIEEFKKKENLK